MVVGFRLLAWSLKTPPKKLRVKSGYLYRYAQPTASNRKRILKTVRGRIGPEGRALMAIIRNKIMNQKTIEILKSFTVEDLINPTTAASIALAVEIAEGE